MSSVIVYGPRGCGKTRNAEALRKAYRCASIVDEAGDCYPRGQVNALLLDAGSTLYLTSFPPPYNRKHRLSRHVVPFSIAICQVKESAR